MSGYDSGVGSDVVHGVAGKGCFGLAGVVAKVIVVVGFAREEGAVDEDGVVHLVGPPLVGIVW